MDIRNKLSVVVLVLCSIITLPSHADDSWASRDYDFASRQLDDFMSRHQRDLVDPVSRGVRRDRVATKPAAHAPRVNTTVPARVAQVPKAMAAQYPARDRARMEQTFSDLLTGYAKIEKQFGLPQRDLAGAVAAFVAGSYMGYHGTDFPDRQFLPLVEQMRSIIAAEPAYAAASPAARQEMYEHLTILGMFAANAQMALKQQPNPQTAARMRQACKTYLERFLKTDADRVLITDQGLVIQ
jgi:hypothetical protein